MAVMFKARYSTLYSLLFVSIVCQSFAATRSNLQIAESDNPREVFKKALSASHSVKSYRVRIEIPSVSNVVTIIEYALPDRARISEKNDVTLWIDKYRYHKKGGLWEKYPYPEITSDISMWGRNLEKGSRVSMIAFPAIVLENLIKKLAQTGDIKFIGQETIDGIPTLAYQHTIGSNTEPNTMKTWIGLEDGLLRRWEFECDLLGSKPSPVIYTYYDYNAEIKIEPPELSEMETIQVDPKLASPRISDMPTGDPKGVPGPPSAGPGSGGGMGTGSGEGTGLGPGHGFNTGGGGPSLGGGSNPNVPVKDVDQRPIALNNPQPRYTEEARKNKVEGIVLARALIGSDGLVKKVAIIRGLPDGLDEQAIEAVYQLKFKPAMKGGQPVPFLQTVQIEFNLELVAKLKGAKEKIE